MSQFDASDALILIGVLLLGGAMYLAASWAGVLAYFGTVCLVGGLAWARERSIKQFRKDR